MKRIINLVLVLVFFSTVAIAQEYNEENIEFVAPAYVVTSLDYDVVLNLSAIEKDFVIDNLVEESKNGFIFTRCILVSHNQIIRVETKGIKGKWSMDNISTDTSSQKKMYFYADNGYKLTLIINQA